MDEQSIFTQVIAEIQRDKNHSSSAARCKVVVNRLEQLLEKRVLVYFASEAGTDFSSMINDEDVFLIENLLNVSSTKKDLVLILHSDGGSALAAERIIEICRNYCVRRNDSSKFIVVIPKKAKSAATIVSLAADEIFLRGTAELGPVDPQFVTINDAGQLQSEPAYFSVDALENLFAPEGRKFFNWLTKNKNKPLTNLPIEVKLKLLEQCNYPLYINAKNELGLSDSIIEKIQKEKVRNNPKISPNDFDIFRDPHITKSHGRIINYSDLENNSLRKEGIIKTLEQLFATEPTKHREFDALLWELYVRKRQMLNDSGNKIVKTIEVAEELLVHYGSKKGQKKDS